MSDFPINAQALGTIIGVAIVVMGLTQLIKPALELRFGLIEGEDPDPETLKRYSAAVNLLSLGLGLLFAIGGHAATTEVHSGDGYLSAALVGIGGAITAIGVYEPINNGAAALRSALQR